MQLIATRDLPTLGVREGQTFTAGFGAGRQLVRKGLARQPLRAEARVAAEAGELPAPLAGSPTGEAAPASSSDRGPAPGKKTSSKSKAAPRS